MEEAFELPANVEALVVGGAIGGEEPYNRANGNFAGRCPWHCTSVFRLTQSPLLCLEPYTLRLKTRVDAIR